MCMSDDLKQVAAGCHTRVKTYNTYDVNGFRFRTDKYEKERPNAATINSGLVTVGQGENDETTEYHGYIKEIIELSFDGIKPLNLVLFNCHWFHPNRVRYTSRYGLVEVEHESVLPGYEPFVVAQQATQVYYIPYPCKSVRDLAKRWVVYKVRQPGKLPAPSDQDYEGAPVSVEFFQEDGLEGNFVIDLGEGLDDMSNIERDAEEIVDDDDLRLLNSSEIPAAAQEDSVIETIIEYSDDDLAVVSDEDDPRLDEYF